MAVKFSTQDSNGGGSYVYPKWGVHQAKYSGVSDELKTSDNMEAPYFFMRFDITSGENQGLQASRCVMATGEALAFCKRMGVVVTPQSTSPEDIYKAVASATINWEGLIKISGKKGYIEHLQLPPGVYTFRFVRFASRKNGLACEWKNKDNDDYIARVLFMVDGGKYDGWLQTMRLPVSYRRLGDGDVDFTGKALFELLAKHGVVAGDFGNHKIGPDESILPKCEEVLIMKAKTHAISGVVDGKYYSPDWRTIAGIDLSPDAEMSDTVAMLIKGIAQVYFGDDRAIDDGGETLTDDGKFIGKNVIKVAATALPWSGIRAAWPPYKWGAVAMEHAVNIFGALSGLSKESLMLYISDDGRANERLSEWFKKNIQEPQVETEEAF